jgi:transposase
MSLELRP